MIDQKAMEGGRIRAHSIHIDERQLMRVSGVKDVDSEMCIRDRRKGCG